MNESDADARGEDDQGREAEVLCGLKFRLKVGVERISRSFQFQITGTSERKEREPKFVLDGVGTRYIYKLYKGFYIYVVCSDTNTGYVILCYDINTGSVITYTIITLNNESTDYLIEGQPETDDGVQELAAKGGKQHSNKEVRSRNKHPRSRDAVKETASKSAGDVDVNTEQSELTDSLAWPSREDEYGIPVVSQGNTDHDDWVSDLLLLKSLKFGWLSENRKQRN